MGETGDTDEMRTVPSDKDVEEFAESIADHMAQDYVHWPHLNTRSAIIEAVRLVLGDARLETRRLLAPEGVLAFFELRQHGRASVDDPQPLPVLRFFQDGGTVEVPISERQVLSLITQAADVLRQRDNYRRYEAERTAASGRTEPSKETS